MLFESTEVSMLSSLYEKEKEKMVTTTLFATNTTLLQALDSSVGFKHWTQFELDAINASISPPAKTISKPF